MNLAEIKLSPEVRRRIRTRYREQMKKWAPKFVQSRAPPAAKGLMVMMTDIWEGKGKPSKSKRRPHRGARDGGRTSGG